MHVSADLNGDKGSKTGPVTDSVLLVITRDVYLTGRAFTGLEDAGNPALSCNPG
jgi:hypothetical protein